MPVPASKRVRGIAGVGNFREGAGSARYNAGASLLNGSTTMTRIVVAASIRTVITPTTNNVQIWFEEQGNNSAGWRILWISGTGRIRLAVQDGGGTTRQADAVLPLLPAGRLAVMAGSFDGTTRVRTNLGTTAISGAGAGYTPATQTTEIGNRSALTQACVDWAICAALGTDLVARTDAEMAADIAVIIDNLEQGRALDTGLAWAPQRYWDGNDVAQSGVPKAQWVDRIGGGILNREGPPRSFFYDARFS